MAAHYDWLFALMLAICIIMIFLNLYCLGKFRAYKNLSSATLIGLVILKFSWTAIIMGLELRQPDFYVQNFLTLMDLTMFI